MLHIGRFTCLMILVSLWSCQNKVDSLTPKKMNLIGKEIKVDTILEAGNMQIHNNLLLKRRHYKADYAIRIFDLADFSLVSDVLTIGRGPGEVVNPAGGMIDEQNDILWLTDWGKDVIHRIHIDSLIANPGYKPNTSFPLNPSWIPTMNMFYHPSGNIGFTSVMRQKNMVSFMDLNGNLVDSMAIPFKIYPDTWKDMGYSDVPLICKYIPEFDRMVIVSRHENKFSLIEMDGAPIWQKDDIPEAGDKVFAGNWENSFYTICADDTYIFLVYSGGRMGDFDAAGEFQVKYPRRLLVVDWEGNFRYDIALDHGLMFAILDKERKRLIGDTKDFDNYLVSYDLSKLYEE